MKANGGVEVQALLFFASALVEVLNDGWLVRLLV
jgi:hypothetical protein